MSLIQSIPASEIVAVNPNVINAGGTGLTLSGLLLTTSTRVPIGDVEPFPTEAAVAAFFGAGSEEAVAAASYFAGFDNSNIKPGSLLFTQYPELAAVPPYLRGGNVSTLTLTQLQAITGVLTATINGETHTSSTIDLSGATSFSDAAATITTDLDAFDALVTGAISGTTLTVSAVSAGVIHIGQEVTGAGVIAGTTITAFGSGTGGTGTYTVSAAQTVASEALGIGPAVVTFDSQSGAFIVTGGTPGAVATISFGSGSIAAPLKLRQQDGAVISQGANVATPGPFMDAIAAQFQNWATFSTLFEPTTDDKVAFATWENDQNNRYVYVMWDTDASVLTDSDTSSALHTIKVDTIAGVYELYANPALGSFNGVQKAAFIMGSVASIDFTQFNGRTTMAFRSQAGLAADVTDATSAQNLIANGGNFYGSYATAAQQFVWEYPGQITGPFEWLDSYINQIWLNNALQLALMELLAAVKSIPYNPGGYALIEAAMSDPINAAVNFGAIRAGVTLSSAQIAEVNAAAGLVISTTLQQRGWYLQILDASPQVRAARGSPPITLWYMDGQSVQRISLASILIQ